MRKVLLVGNAPLPNENTQVRPAAGLRTYQFLKPLSGYELRLVAITMPECYGAAGYAGAAEVAGGTTAAGYAGVASGAAFSKDDPNLLSKVRAVHDEFQPDVIVGVNTYPSFVASQIGSGVPFWADLNGWIMAEAQAQAYKMGSDDYLPHYYDMEQAVLSRADKFSTVSEAQRFAVLGELAGLGRLNAETFAYDFCEHVPNGIEWFEGEEEAAEADLPELLPVPEEAFVILWMGGYNTWVDETTLFRGVAAAMEHCENLYFVSTGGEIAGLDDETFTRFRGMIEESPWRERFVFLGWVETQRIPYIYKRANAGLNVDRRCVETLTGARNRINEMMKFGLPVITTLGSEISYEVMRAGAGVGVRSGDEAALAEAIVAMYKANERERLGYGERGRTYISEECNYARVMKPLLAWLENPLPAPDREIFVNLERGALRSGLRYLRKHGLGKFSKKVWQRLRTK